MSKLGNTLKFLLMFVFLSLLVGCSSTNNQTAADKSMLKTADLVKAFQSGGVQLKEDPTPTNNFLLDGVKPDIFQLTNSKASLIVYAFNQYGSRVKCSNKFIDSPDSIKFFKPLLSNQYPFLRKFEAKNILLIYVPNIRLADTTNKNELSNLENIVFKLNNGKQLIYTGEGNHWQGQIIIKYYEHWWKDQNGTTHYDGYHSEQPIIKYKGANINNLGLIDYQYTCVGETLNGHGMKINSNGTLPTSYHEGNGPIPRNDTVFEVTIEWNGQKETFEMKP